jgi:hypothetical protein
MENHVQVPASLANGRGPSGTGHEAGLVQFDASPGASERKRTDGKILVRSLSLSLPQLRHDNGNVNLTNYANYCSRIDEQVARKHNINMAYLIRLREQQASAMI